MDTKPLRSTTITIDFYIKLAQYPILSDNIREQMRQELFARGVIDPEQFQQEVIRQAHESQRREGVYDPLNKEPKPIWHRRMKRVRDYLTDAYFGRNLPNDLFDQIVHNVVRQRRTTDDLSYELPFNPEIAPKTLLFEQGMRYEELPPPEKVKIHHHLEEIKVVLIKEMISDQLRYVGIAKKVFSIHDLKWIDEHRIGEGKIGGKAGGMLLAWKILKQRDSAYGPDISEWVDIPETYFIGTDVIYEFRDVNGLDFLMNQKYRSLEEVRSEYPAVQKAHLSGKFPVSFVDRLRDVLRDLGSTPIIVRSSSLLEDNFGTSFAGKYESIFCPNQGTEKENLKNLLDAIRKIYASTFNPDAILYRQHHSLIDYDERMAILLQGVRGETHGRYFFPTLAGVAFSQNPFRWSPKIRRDEGFLRLVWGMGTRAVDRVSQDYPRLIALGNPTLRPEKGASAIQQYSQHIIDVIDLEDNVMRSLPVKKVLHLDYPYLRYFTSQREGDSIRDIVSPGMLKSTHQLVLTFDFLTKDAKFLKLFRTALQRLEAVYEAPVDVEFTVEIIPRYPYPDYQLNILQCRPLSLRSEIGPVSIPTELAEQDVLFRTFELIPDGRAEDIRYIIFINPLTYRTISDVFTKQELGRVVGRLNKKLENERFILIGPGRWGSSNIDLGVRVSYADIFNTKVLIEMSVANKENIPELSYGTHFFQDLVEGGIHSLPLHLENPKSNFDWAFFEGDSNSLAQLLPDDAHLSEYIHVIDVASIRKGHLLQILMDGSNDEAVGFISKGEWNQTQDNVAQKTFSTQKYG